MSWLTPGFPILWRSKEAQLWGCLALAPWTLPGDPRPCFTWHRLPGHRHPLILVLLLWWAHTLRSLTYCPLTLAVPQPRSQILPSRTPPQERVVWGSQGPYPRGWRPAGQAGPASRSQWLWVWADPPGRLPCSLIKVSFGNALQARTVARVGVGVREGEAETSQSPLRASSPVSPHESPQGAGPLVIKVEQGVLGLAGHVVLGGGLVASAQPPTPPRSTHSHTLC